MIYIRIMRMKGDKASMNKTKICLKYFKVKTNKIKVKIKIQLILKCKRNQNKERV
jgi:hypothetical protein